MGIIGEQWNPKECIFFYFLQPFGMQNPRTQIQGSREGITAAPSLMPSSHPKRPCLDATSDFWKKGTNLMVGEKVRKRIVYNAWCVLVPYLACSTTTHRRFHKGFQLYSHLTTCHCFIHSLREISFLRNGMLKIIRRLYLTFIISTLVSQHSAIFWTVWVIITKITVYFSYSISILNKFDIKMSITEN